MYFPKKRLGKVTTWVKVRFSGRIRVNTYYYQFIVINNKYIIGICGPGL